MKRAVVGDEAWHHVHCQLLEISDWGIRGWMVGGWRLGSASELLASGKRVGDSELTILSTALERNPRLEARDDTKKN